MKTSDTDQFEAIEPKPADQLWPMGAVARRTGLTEHTLRAWERRFGFPMPVRLPSGHRRYTSEQVRHLLLITLALDHGCRAGDVVPMPLDRLEALLREAGALDGSPPKRPDDHWLDGLMESVRRFDAGALSSALHRDAGVLGLPSFLRERVAPLLRELGEGWAGGRIDVRHEHFASEVLETCLRSLRSPLEAAASGPPLLLVTLPGEGHELGLQMVALAAVMAGRSVRVLGPSTPVDEIAAAATALAPLAVGVSVSAATANETTRILVLELRGRLAPEVALWLGGAGAAMLGALPDGIERIDGLDELDAVMTGLTAQSVEGPQDRTPSRR